MLCQREGLARRVRATYTALLGRAGPPRLYNGTTRCTRNNCTRSGAVRAPLCRRRRAPRLRASRRARWRHPSLPISARRGRLFRRCRCARRTRCRACCGRPRKPPSTRAGEASQPLQLCAALHRRLRRAWRISRSRPHAARLGQWCARAPAEVWRVPPPVRRCRPANWALTLHPFYSRCTRFTY